jgi:starch phosphorylase
MLNQLDRTNSYRAEEIQQELLVQLTRNVGVSQADATPRDWLRAASLAVRGHLVDRYHAMNARLRQSGAKQVAFLSMEFLMARQLEGALMATGLRDVYVEALERLGTRLDDLLELEPDPALGNGGLGRLAACFLESMASTGVQGYGYGIRYEYGMFRQEIADGWQVERPDDWLSNTNPWEFERPEPVFTIGIGGHVEHRDQRAIWHPGEQIIAVAHDMLVPGLGGETVNTLRLWGAKPINAFDIASFNRGHFLEALAPKIRSKAVTRLLYPDDSTPEGRELRLRQEHFFASASVQDVLRRFLKDHGCDWSLLPSKVAIHLNDTHPALAPAELMRLLVDVHELPWERARELASDVFSYTNHTLMPEALEVWRADLMRRIAPRHLEIIDELNRRFVGNVRREVPGFPVDRVAVVRGEHEERSVNMGRFSVLMSHRVNGVSALHSGLVQERLFPEFAELFPGRFLNVTNGISPRLWLFQTNPALCDLMDRHVGRAWRDTFDLSGMVRFAGDPEVLEELRAIKLDNKRRLATVIAQRTGIEVDPASMFDVQIKRIHEYKRQLLNILGVIARWNAMKGDPNQSWAPRTVVLAGKAASSYWLAKLIIKLANDVARRINADRDTSHLLKLVFLPNYNVSLAERIIPAADLSQQISLAGTEASGTGNMKLALNGALTLGTRDGANIEIAEAVGEDLVFSFGMDVGEVQALKREGYMPREVCNADPRLRTVLEQIARGDFSPDDPHRFEPIINALLNEGDRFMVLADFADYWRAQREVDAIWGDQREWSRRALLNISRMGGFSADRSIERYADAIWRVTAEGS